jgi:predicted ATPase
MADGPEPRARIVEIGGRSLALGGEVVLRLAEPFTVLVGRNAAGKSALLRLINEFAVQACAGGQSRPFWRIGEEFRCTVAIAGSEYRYTASCSSRREGEFNLVWSEQCLDLVSGGTKLWSTEGGVVAGPSTQILVPPSSGLLALDPSSLPGELGTVAAAFGHLFRHVTLVPAGLPATIERMPPLFFRKPGAKDFEMRESRGGSRLDRLAMQLMRWHQTDDESLERVQEVLRRIGVCETLNLKTFGEAGELAFIFMDGHDLSEASDGTLRVLDLVVALELAAAGALVMIEEPETGIHPGLSDRIMAEIESAAEGLQLIISTHSPRILDRVQHHQLRHVRRNGSTRIDALTPEQVKEVKAFLDHDGTLSDYVFSPDFTGEDDDAEPG